MSSYSAITVPMTKWRGYQSLENTEDFCKNDLDNISEVKISLNKTAIYKPKEYSSSLIILREQILHISANEESRKYTKDIQTLEIKVIDLAEEIRALSKDKTLLTAFNPETKIKTLTQNLIEFNEKLQCELNKILKNPIKNDKRCSKANIKKLDKLTHQACTEKINKWSQRNEICADVTQEECWKWKGQLKALRRIEMQLGYFAHSVHNYAICADAFIKNASNEEFWIRNKQLETEELNKKQAKIEKQMIIEARSSKTSFFGALVDALGEGAIL